MKAAVAAFCFSQNKSNISKVSTKYFSTEWSEADKQHFVYLDFFAIKDGCPFLLEVNSSCEKWVSMTVLRYTYVDTSKKTPCENVKTFKV